MAKALRDLVRSPRTLLLTSALAASLGGCSGMARQQEIADVAPPPAGAVLTQAGTDAPAKKRDADGQCLACFPGVFQMPLFGLR